MRAIAAGRLDDVNGLFFADADISADPHNSMKGATEELFVKVKY